MKSILRTIILFLALAQPHGAFAMDNEDDKWKHFLAGNTPPTNNISLPPDYFPLISQQSLPNSIPDDSKLFALYTYTEKEVKTYYFCLYPACKYRNKHARNYSTYHKTKMKYHLFVHVGIKLFECEPCGFFGVHQSCLNRHFKSNKHQRRIAQTNDNNNNHQT